MRRSCGRRRGTSGSRWGGGWTVSSVSWSGRWGAGGLMGMVEELQQRARRGAGELANVRFEGPPEGRGRSPPCATRTSWLAGRVDELEQGQVARRAGGRREREQGPRVIRYVVRWAVRRGRWALMTSRTRRRRWRSRGLAESGQEPRVDGPMAWDDAPEEVRAAAWARVASADLADRAEELARCTGITGRWHGRCWRCVTTKKARRVMGEPLREVISNG